MFHVSLRAKVTPFSAARDVLQPLRDEVASTYYHEKELHTVFTDNQLS